MLGYEMPPLVRQWAERSTHGSTIWQNSTESGLRRISDSLK